MDIKLISDKEKNYYLKDHRINIFEIKDIDLSSLEKSELEELHKKLIKYTSDYYHKKNKLYFISGFFKRGYEFKIISSNRIEMKYHLSKMLDYSKLT